MNELYFVGMDISEETKHIVISVGSKCTNGMNENELKAYNLGVENTLSALKAILETSTENELILNINGIETPTEFDSDDLMCHLSNCLEY